MIKISRVDATIESLMYLKLEHERYERALVEIRDVAEISEGTQWYAMMAREALGRDG